VGKNSFLMIPYHILPKKAMYTHIQACPPPARNGLAIVWEMDLGVILPEKASS
jgi:hypothetical protein